MVDATVVERVLCVVDRCLKAQFPDDYYKRCLYASFGVHSLLQSLGHSPEVLGADFQPLWFRRISEGASFTGMHLSLASILIIGWNSMARLSTWVRTTYLRVQVS